MVTLGEHCPVNHKENYEVEDLSLNDLDYISDISTTPGLVKLIDK